MPQQTLFANMWGAPLLRVGAATAMSPTTTAAPHAPRSVLTARPAAATPWASLRAMASAAQNTGVLRWLSYAPRLLSLTNPVGWGVLAASVLVDDAIKHPLRGTTHAYLPVVEPPKVVGEVYPAHEEQRQPPLGRPDHLPQGLEPTSDGYSILNPQAWPEPLTGMPWVPTQAGPTIEGYREHIARAGDGIHLSSERDPSFTTWFDQATHPEALKALHSEDIETWLAKNPGAWPRVVALETDIQPINERPYLHSLTYAPTVEVNGQRLAIPVEHLPNAYHGFKGIYDSTTGRLDLSVNSARAIEGADQHFGSEAEQVRAVLEKLDWFEHPVNMVYLRLSSNQTGHGRGLIDRMQPLAEDLYAEVGPQGAHDFIVAFTKAMNQPTKLKAMDKVLSVVTGAGFSVRGFVTDPYSQTYDTSPVTNADRWIVLQRNRATPWLDSRVE